MIIRTKDFKHRIALSYSRIKTLQHCSQKYYCTYILKMPDLGNDGANRGTVLHSVLEILIKDRRKNIVTEILNNKTCKKNNALWKFIKAHAKMKNVNDEDNLNLIDEFIVTGLKTEFYGPENVIETYVEKEFDLEIEGKGMDYRIKGIIDKLFISKDNDNLYIYIQDYKSSKVKFNDIEENIQGAIYQLAIKYLYPNIPLKEFKFIFVKFPKKPIQQFPLFSEQELYGFQYFLTEIQKQIDNFDESNIFDNFGALNEKMKNLCGPAKSGWICPHQKPLNYYILINENGDIVKTSFNNDLVPQNNEKIELKKYEGCNYFYKNGEKRQISYE